MTRRTEIASQIRDLMEDENAPEKIHIMSQYLDMLETDPTTEQRYEGKEEMLYLIMHSTLKISITYGKEPHR